MKKILLLFFVLFVFSIGYLAGEPAPGFDNYVDFGISMKELDALVKNGNLKAAVGKYLILNGSISGYTVTDKDESSYSVEVELVNGEWSGVSDVFIYRSIIVFKGKEYLSRFPAKRKSTPDPGEIPINSGLIVVAKVKDTRNESGRIIPVLEGSYLRVYK